MDFGVRPYIPDPEIMYLCTHVGFGVRSYIPVPGIVYLCTHVDFGDKRGRIYLIW